MVSKLGKIKNKIIDFNLSQLSNERWVKYLLNEIEIPKKIKNRIPIMPPEDIQVQFTGAKGKNTLLMSLEFYKIANYYLTKSKMSPNKNKKLLDFGCGWGRMIRMWLKDLPNENIYGVDPLQDMIDLCKKTIPGSNFYKIKPEPPIQFFEKEMFDYLTAYSVFSHLNEEYSRIWLNEFSRIIKKKGLLFITTRSRLFIQYCSDLRERSNFEKLSNNLSTCFLDKEFALRKFDNGEVVHEPTGAGTILTSNYYGETCIPKQFFMQFEDFNVLDFIPQLQNEPTQSCVILEKK